jgi:hypothetical protein
MRRAHILANESELVIFMTNLAHSSLSSAVLSVQHHQAATDTEIAPWRGILAVEPDFSVLNAKSLLLTKANYRVTRATSERELFTLQGTRAVALAILSDHLGQRLLGTVAETVRRQWPRARILILGQAPRMLEDYLYDERIDRSPNPKQVLADLEQLYKGMWNRRTNAIDWDARRRYFARAPIPESDPACTIEPATIEDPSLRDRPSAIRLSATQHHGRRRKTESFAPSWETSPTLPFQRQS